MEKILVAAAARKAFTFVQYNPKSGKSCECYEVYMMVTTFAGLETIKGVYLPGTTRPVFRVRAMTLSGDFLRDVAHGLYLQINKGARRRRRGL